MKKLNLLISPYFVMLAALLCLFASCESSKSGPVELVFAFGPDDGNTVQPLIDQFNEQNKGSVHVTWKEGSRSSNEFYQQMLVDLKSEIPEVDVFGADVIWTPALASQGLVGDMTQVFFDKHDPADFVEASMNSASYQLRVWGLPWFADAGILYYRKDLLEKSGYKYPPATWEELIEVSNKIKKDSGILYGYVFQGAEYEGGVTNACEFIWNAGGQVLIGDLASSGAMERGAFDPSVIMVNSDETRRGLTDLQKLVESGLLPPNIHEFREREAGQAFQNGDAIFMRSWASGYSFLLDPNTKVQPGDVGLTPLPTSGQNMIPYSCLGGWNLMVNNKLSDEKKAAAWKFIEHMASVESQQYRAMKGGILPSLRMLYQDEALLAKAPVMEFARQVIPVCRERPRSPHYMSMSPEIANVFNQILKGETTPEMAVMKLDMKLETVLAEK